MRFDDQLLASLEADESPSGEKNRDPILSDPAHIPSRLRKLHPDLTRAQVSTLSAVASIDSVGRICIETPKGGSVAPSRWAIEQVLERARDVEKASRPTTEPADDDEVGQLAPAPPYSPTRRR